MRLEKTTFNYRTNNQALCIGYEKEGRHVYLKIGVNPNNETQKILLYSMGENKPGHIKQVMERESKTPDDVLKNSIDKY